MSSITRPRSPALTTAGRRRLPGDRSGGSRTREIVSWLVTLALAGALVAVIKLTGLSLVVVTTDSMEPTLMPRDYVVTVSPRLLKPAIGSIVEFTPTYAGAQLPAHIHRLVGVNPDGTWRTRGDNSNGNDPWSVQPNQVRGVATGLRLPASVARSPWVIGSGAFAVALLLLWPRPDARGIRSTPDETAGQNDDRDPDDQ